MRTIIFAISWIIAVLSVNDIAFADGEVETFISTKPFDIIYEQLLKSVGENKMGVVAQACAHCGAKSIGKSIPGNRVIMVFNPKFAVRMLEANIAAGIEAPLRIYLIEKADGSTELSYPVPTTVFAPYNTPELDDMAKELDIIFASIAIEAVR